MNKKTINNKINIKFILITLLALILLIVASLFFSKQSSGVDPSDLPDDIDSKINKLVINEVMSSNSGVYVNSDGKPTDYIELYNGTSKTINLNGYGLSDRKDEIKWAFNDVSIEPGAYLVVSLDSENSSGTLNANFSLKAAGGENVILTNSSGKVIDAVQTIALEKNEVMCRNENGSWITTYDATPGFENSLTGKQEYITSLSSDDDSLIISEFLVTNKGNFINEYGRCDGFIEIYNNSNETIDLSKCLLSNDASVPFKFQLPQVDLNPGSYYYIYTGTNNESNAKDYYTGFKLNSDAGSIVLVYNGKIVENFSYDNVTSGMSYISDGNGFTLCNVVTPGYSNDNDGANDFQYKYLSKNSGLIINEVMNNNKDYLAQNGNNYYDFVELYNNSNETINLSEYYLSNNHDELNKYQLPDVELGGFEYIVIMCSGDCNLSNNSYYHSNFKIGDYDGIYLSKGSKLIDSTFIGNTSTSVSYSRSDYGYTYAVPTPGYENNTGDRFISSTPSITAGGVFNDVNDIEITINGSGDIYYTTDGSDPDSSDNKYTGPFTINETTVIHAVSYANNSKKSDIVSSSFIINENHTLPVMSISLNPSSFNDIRNDSYGNGYEVKCIAEFYEDGNSFNVPCSIALFGNNARGQAKQSFALRFKQEYGLSKLNYHMFSNRDNSCYDSLVLRSGSTDWDEAIIRDILGTSLVDDYTDIDVQAYRPCILYVNGNYYGIYNIREKINSSFIEEHYNVDVSELDLAGTDGDVKAGDTYYYEEVRYFINNHNMANSTNYEKVKEMIDIDNIIDYWIAEAFIANNDVLNVRYFDCPNIDDNKLKYIYFDLDYGFYNTTIDYFTDYLANETGYMGQEGTYQVENDIIRGLLDNSEFRERFVERLSYNCQNTWNPDNISKRIDEIVALYEPEIERDRKAYGLTVSEWEEEIEALRTWCTKRMNYFLNSVQDFFNLSNSEMKEYFGDLWN